MRQLRPFVVMPLRWSVLVILLGLTSACTGERFSQGGDAGGPGGPDSEGAAVDTANGDMTSEDDLLGPSQGDELSGGGSPGESPEGGHDDQLDDSTESDDVGPDARPVVDDASSADGNPTTADDVTGQADDASPDDGSMPSEVDASSSTGSMMDLECPDVGVCQSFRDAGDITSLDPDASDEMGEKPEAGTRPGTTPEAGPVLPDCSEDSLFGPNNHCYFISTQQDDWDGARERCVERGEGWDLVSILDEAEHEWLTSHLVEDTWIGASDAEETDTWVWVDTQTVFWRGKQDGSPVDGAFSIWFNGGPTDIGAIEQCARYSVREGVWYFADIPCGRDYFFACEWAAN